MPIVWGVSDSFFINNKYFVITWKQCYTKWFSSTEKPPPADWHCLWGKYVRMYIYRLVHTVHGIISTGTTIWEGGARVKPDGLGVSDLLSEKKKMQYYLKIVLHKMIIVWHEVTLLLLGNSVAQNDFPPQNPQPAWHSVTAEFCRQCCMIKMGALTVVLRII